jgi:hypothetical protein
MPLLGYNGELPDSLEKPENNQTDFVTCTDKVVIKCQFKNNKEIKI